MTEVSKDAVKTALSDLRAKPELDKFTRLQKAMIQFVQIKLDGADTDVTQALKELSDQVSAMRAEKERTNASVVSLQSKLVDITKALDVCKASQAQLEKQKQLYEDSLAVVRNTT